MILNRQAVKWIDLKVLTTKRFFTKVWIAEKVKVTSSSLISWTSLSTWTNELRLTCTAHPVTQSNTLLGIDGRK